MVAVMAPPKDMAVSAKSAPAVTNRVNNASLRRMIFV